MGVEKALGRAKVQYEYNDYLWETCKKGATIKFEDGHYEMLGRVLTRSRGRGVTYMKVITLNLIVTKIVGELVK